jgi:hypothetical protein
VLGQHLSVVQGSKN